MRNNERMTRFHFISGLPRSGSSLLAGILRQNFRFYANISGPVAGMFGSLLNNMSARNEFSVFITDDKRMNILKHVLAAYYDDLTNINVVFDTNRAWCSKLKVLKSIFPESRVIACVRDIPWVIDSVERLVRNNVFQPSSIFSYSANGTVYSRVESILKSDGLVGFAYNALKEAYFSEDTANLMLLRYESLVNDPARTLAAVYDFIGEPYYNHDFEHVYFENNEFDARAGTPGLHRIRPKVAPLERESILPPDLFNRFKNDAFWADSKLNIRGVHVV